MGLKAVDLDMTLGKLIISSCPWLWQSQRFPGRGEWTDLHNYWEQLLEMRMSIREDWSQKQDPINIPFSVNKTDLDRDGLKMFYFPYWLGK